MIGQIMMAVKMMTTMMTMINVRLTHKTTMMMMMQFMMMMMMLMMMMMMMMTRILHSHQRLLLHCSNQLPTSGN